VVKDLQPHVWPTNEQSNHAKKVYKEYKLLEAEEKLNICLLKNAKTQRGPSGRPTICEEVAKMLILANGASQLNEMTNNFNLAFGK
jgi:hypothetical protein